MKKALVIASCGLVLALIIGATRQHAEPEETKTRFNTIKCLESTNEKERTECAQHAITHRNDLTVDIFLRPIKRKARYYYA